MPPNLKNMVGKKLSINIPDIKGNNYRKRYFECLKNERKDCFVSYYFLNPLTKRYEKKISYFAIMKPYNWVFVKGMYESQILKRFEILKQQVYRNINSLFKKALVLLAILSFFIILFSYFISKVIMKEILKNYENMRRKFLKKFFFDEITKLPNRAKLIEDITKRNYKGLILVDIDNFTDINDIYGFKFGDEVLNRVSNVLKEYYKNVYKIGSDEFAIGLEREIKRDDLLRLSNLKPVYNDVVINLTIGASNSKERLLETSEIALKYAYKQYSKKYKLFDENIETEQIEKIDKIQFLHKVLEKKAIEPYFHCIVDKDGNIVKYEALMRIIWDGEVYEPKDFMELLKESKMYLKFSDIMIRKVFNYLPLIDKTVSINLSFEDLNSREIKSLIYEELSKTDKKICFEILESESIKDFEIVKNFIFNVKKLGAEIAIDDFGSGYSNFINIIELSPDYLKIDSTIIKKIEDEKFREIVKIITEFAKKIGIGVTAEYVKNEIIYKILKEIGIDEYQGYYFCRPQPINRIKNVKIP
jgi:diguanylate cyclase (GGDEF)-like protein